MMSRQHRPEGAPPNVQYVYSAYRTKDDTIICFEEPARRAAEILGIRAQTLYERVSKQRAHPEKNWRYIVTRTPVRELGID